MKQSPLLIATKCQPPDPGPVVARERLHKELHAGLGRRVTLVQAGPGFGKTVLLADFARRAPLPVAWYQADQEDGDLVRFLWHLVLSVERAVAGSLNGTRDLLSSAAMPLRDPQVAAATFISDLVHDEMAGLVLCIDDWHRVPVDSGTAAFIKVLIPYLPVHVHVYVTCRTRGESWPARWELQGWLEEVSLEKLRFDADEAEELFRIVHGVTLPPGTARQAVERTDGWAAGLYLLGRSLRARPDMPASGDGLSLPPGDAGALGAYLDAEVMANLPPDRLAFLLDTAILEDLPVALCDQLRGATGAGAHLAALAADGLFTSKVDSSVYRYHPLFRDHLVHRLQAERGAEGVARLHRRAAEIAVSSGDRTAAIRHLLAAGDGGAAAALVEELEEPALWGQSATSVSTWLSQLPPGLVDTRPRLLRLVADMKRWDGELDAAAAYLERAKTLFHQHGDVAGLASALAGLGHIYLLRGESAEARRLMESAIALTPAHDPGTRALCLVRLAMVEWMEGAPDRCVPLLTEALSLFAGMGDRLGEAWAMHNLAVDVHVARGELREAVAVFHQVADICAGTINRLHCICLLNLGSNLAYLGRHSEGRGYLLRALEMADVLNFAAGRGYVLAYLGRVAAEVGEYSAASAQLREAKEIQDRITEPQLRLEALAAETLLHRQQGRPDEALETARQHLVWAQDTNNPFYVVGSWYHLVLAHVARGAPEDALRALAKAEDHYAGNPSIHSRFHVRMAEAVLALALPAASPRGLEAPLVDLMALAEENGFEGLFIAEGDWGLGLLQTAARMGIAPEFAHRLATRWKQVRSPHEVRPAIALAAEGLKGPRLRIRLLGRFAAELDSQPLSDSTWRGRKPRELAKLLALRFGTPMGLDTCLDALWPHLDRQAAQQNFRVTLHWLRKALGDELVQYSGGFCELNATLTWCDVAEFRKLHHAAGEKWESGDTAGAADLYEQIVQLYRDDLMAQEAPADWQLADRDELRECFLGALHRLALAQARKGHLDQATTLAHRVVALDPVREHTYRLLMQVLARRGRRGEALRIYQVCVQNLWRELGVSPSSATRALYEKLSSADGV